MSNKLTLSKYGKRCTVSISNSSTDQTCTTDYILERFDAEDDRWERHASTSLKLKPKHALNQDYSHFDTTDWRIVSENSYCQRMEEDKLDFDIVSPQGKLEIKSIINLVEGINSTSSFKCSGNACNKIESRFFDHIDDYNWKVEIKNKSDRKIEGRIYWGHWLGSAGYREYQIDGNETIEISPGPNNTHIIGVIKTTANYA